jgi:IS30 family transposase
MKPNTSISKKSHKILYNISDKTYIKEDFMTTTNFNTNIKKYNHFSLEERGELKGYLNLKLSLRTIAKLLNRSVSSISAEVKRGLVEQMDTFRNIYTTYIPAVAERKYQENRLNSGRKSKLLTVQRFLKYAEARILKDKWSPDAIIGHVLRNNIFTKEEVVSTKTLYNYIDQKFLEVRNIHLCDKVKRSPRKDKKDRKHKRKFGKSIELRDPNIDSRDEFGHWEIDLVILGKSSSEALLTIVERKSRKLIIRLVKEKTAHEICRVLSVILNEYPKDTFKSITSDNGSEFAKLTEVFEETYYAHPYSSYERGTNERHNGLIRRFLPKGTTFSSISLEIIRRVEEWCNTLPRKILGYATPNESFKEQKNKQA